MQKEIESIKEAGIYKTERIISSYQSDEIKLSSGKKVINFCANNYLGLSDNKAVIQAAKDTMDSMATVCLPLDLSVAHKTFIKIWKAK